MNEPSGAAEEELDNESDYEGDFLDGMVVLEGNAASEPDPHQLQFV